MACDVDSVCPCPFEGPEKLLEIWFAPGLEYVPDAGTAPKGRSGLRAVQKEVWEEMLDIVKCKILSVVYGEEMDAYLLSESSLFISPHRLILKTCGRTLNLLGLPRILAIAREHAGLYAVYQCFYSRKAFMFPDQQLGPHRDWGLEIEFLDRLFDNGSAYTVGKVNQRGDHWLLYMTTPDDMSSSSGTEISSLASSCISDRGRTRQNEDKWAIVARSGLYSLPLLPPAQDYTIEILMTHLSPHARAAFYAPDSVDPCCTDGEYAPGTFALRLSDDLGISDIFPRHRTHLDAYSFSPCGYSANALIKWGDPTSTSDAVHEDPDTEAKIGEGYYTIHVTPEEGWSYASFECNVPLAARRSTGAAIDNADDIPDLHTLVRRVVRIFEPGKITMTLFVQSRGDGDADEGNDDGETETAVEAAQRAFKAALTRAPKSSHAPSAKKHPESEVGDSSAMVANGGPVGGQGHGWRPVHDKVYKRTDKINYEFGGYDLAFASFEMI
ncbi:S-adenosylmethionine decarboxylase [Fomitiporia mediterranea MF3/22]|uniref:S-adenosylmethionine decarboxylase n=1 Tax=Fomitiporia mediterranea (strain MF3/22) TaxID=694068 RepID=UPI000440926B|nr:S-adenosylmethionine decarboxylase [Fomitiporia mediterranea MF3/22]EJD03318.1 S-adenosylmethionine decarboxylase [Fomitiporia mediterranea MF3/22]